jgi:hypothetical protein
MLGTAAIQNTDRESHEQRRGTLDRKPESHDWSQSKSPADTQRGLTGGRFGAGGLGVRPSVIQTIPKRRLSSRNKAEREAFPPSLSARPVLRRLPRSPDRYERNSRLRRWRKRVRASMLGFPYTSRRCRLPLSRQRVVVIVRMPFQDQGCR